MNTIKEVFHAPHAIIGVIHIQALPGTPNARLEPQQILDHALEEAEIYKKSGIDGVIIENMHDIPYLKEDVGPEIVSMMTLIGHEVKKLTELPCGVQVLAAANRQALAVAQAANLDFIRAEGFVYGHLADEGYIDANAGALLRYRKQIGADHIAVFTDVKKKHSSHALTSDVDIVETAKIAEFFLSDGVIVSGRLTAEPADVNEVTAVKQKIKIPVLIGSGITIDNVDKYISICDACIVGSHFKKDGQWDQPLSQEKIQRFMDKVESLR